MKPFSFTSFTNFNDERPTNDPFPISFISFNMNILSLELNMMKDVILLSQKYLFLLYEKIKY